jgi:Icc protein
LQENILTPAPFHTILQVTDLHYLPQPDEEMYDINTEYYFRFVLQHALKSHPKVDLILITGDLTQIPSSSCYQRILKELKKTNTPCICLPGNHDDWQLMKNLLNTENVSCNKQISIGNWKIICLNSQKMGTDRGWLAESELSFLDQELSKYTEKHSLIAVHHNCLPTGSVWMDTMTIENSEELLTILKRYPQVKSVIHGHTHQQQEFKINGLKILSTPSTCFQFKPKSKNFVLDDTLPGYRFLYLHPEGKLTSEVVRVTIK